MACDQHQPALTSTRARSPLPPVTAADDFDRRTNADDNHSASPRGRRHIHARPRPSSRPGRQPIGGFRLRRTLRGSSSAAKLPRGVGLESASAGGRFGDRGAVGQEPLLHGLPELGVRVAEVGRVEDGQLEGDDLRHQRRLVGEAPVDRRLADPGGGGEYPSQPFLTGPQIALQRLVLEGKDPEAAAPAAPRPSTSYFPNGLEPDVHTSPGPVLRGLGFLLIDQGEYLLSLPT